MSINVKMSNFSDDIFNFYRQIEKKSLNMASFRNGFAYKKIQRFINDVRNKVATCVACANKLDIKIYLKQMFECQIESTGII